MFLLLLVSYQTYYVSNNDPAAYYLCVGGVWLPGLRRYRALIFFSFFPTTEGVEGWELGVVRGGWWWVLDLQDFYFLRTF